MNRQLKPIWLRARAEAFALVKAQIKERLPRGWTVHFAAGWGLHVFDTDGVTIFGRYANNLDLVNLRQRKVIELAADFADTFGLDNQKVKA